MIESDRLILVVDDDALTVDYVESALGKAGHKTVSTTNPMEAVWLLWHHKPNLVLLDMNMPGLDGLTLLGRVRAVSKVPVVMLTGEDDAELAVRAMKAGAQDYLIKPVNPERLLEAIEAALVFSTPSDGGRKISHYTLLREVGRGGMGIVYEASDDNLNRRVALKVLLQEFANDPRFGLRFLREARAAANLTHPGLVLVYEAGRDADNLFIAMEFVDGENLHALRKAGREFSVRETVQIGLEAAHALQAAHEAGLVHRDVKPSNIMQLPTGRIKILDFGLVRPMKSEHTKLTAAGLAAGTPGYASPEALRGLPVTPASDVFSLGTVLYELLANEPPFEEEDPLAAMARTVSGDVKTPLSKIPGVPPNLVKLVERMMAVEPKLRPSGMAEVAQALSILRRS